MSSPSQGEPDALRAALQDIADERGQCSACGELADMPSNCVGCDDYRRCTWSPRNPAQVARAALSAPVQVGEPDALRAALSRLLDAGQMLSNVAFNLGQRGLDRFEARDSASCREAAATWDDKVRAYRVELKAAAVSAPVQAGVPREAVAEILRRNFPASRNRISEAVEEIVGALRGAAALAPAVPEPAGTAIVCDVVTMKLSDGREDHFVSVRRNGKEITPHKFSQKGRAEYEAAEWNWLLNDGEKPWFEDFDLDTVSGAQPVPEPAGAGGDAVVADFLQRLRAANITRNAEYRVKTQGEELPLLFRTTEFAGEVGELLNVVKKIERERLGWSGKRATREMLLEEFGGVVATLDLLAMALDVDLAAATAAEFNAVSERLSLRTVLPAKTPATVKEQTDRGERAEAAGAERERLRFEGDLDKWVKAIGAGITGYQPEAYAVMDAACHELVAGRAKLSECEERAREEARSIRRTSMANLKLAGELERRLDYRNLAYAALQHKVEGLEAQNLALAEVADRLAAICDEADPGPADEGGPLTYSLSSAAMSEIETTAQVLRETALRAKAGKEGDDA